MSISVRLIVGLGIGCAALMVLSACGQKGPLFLPTEPAATGRATLPQSLSPLRATPTVPSSQPAASAPASTPSQ